MHTRMRRRVESLIQVVFAVSSSTESFFFWLTALM